jgi:hypothetical protein
VRSWYQRLREAKSQIERAVHVAREEAAETRREYVEETRRPESGRRPTTPEMLNGIHTDMVMSRLTRGSATSAWGERG